MVGTLAGVERRGVAEKLNPFAVYVYFVAAGGDNAGNFDLGRIIPIRPVSNRIDGDWKRDEPLCGEVET